MAFAGGFPGGADYMTPGEQWSQEAADSSRRFSVDASGGSGLPLHMQGSLLPRGSSLADGMAWSLHHRHCICERDGVQPVVCAMATRALSSTTAWEIIQAFQMLALSSTDRGSLFGRVAFVVNPHMRRTRTALLAMPEPDRMPRCRDGPPDPGSPVLAAAQCSADGLRPGAGAE